MHPFSADLDPEFNLLYSLYQALSAKSPSLVVEAQLNIRDCPSLNSNPTH